MEEEILMDQAQTLRSLVNKKIKIILIITAPEFYHRIWFCNNMTKILTENNKTCTYIEIGNVTDSTLVVCLESLNLADDYINQLEDQPEYMIIGTNSINDIKLLSKYDTDIYVLTDSTPESLIGSYEYVKTMVMNNIYISSENRIKLITGPAKSEQEALNTIDDFTYTLKKYVNYKIETVGWFNSSEDIHKIAQKYL